MPRRFPSALAGLALLGFAPALHAQPPKNILTITEILTNPGGSIIDANGEWFEVYNTTDSTIDLSGWMIQDSAASGLRPYHTISSFSIPAYGLVVFGNSSNTTLNGGVPVDYVYGAAMALANSLDKVRIVYPAPAGQPAWDDTPPSIGVPAPNPAPEAYVIERVRYTTAAISAQNGISRYLTNVALDNHSIDGANWADALVTDVYGEGGRGTPGKAGGTAGVLPVELVSFTAALDGPAAARLAWATASESGNSGFQIETRAPGAADFRRVAFVPGRGTTSEAHRYDYRVERLAPGRHAFRLRQIDLDGTASLSPTVEIVVGQAAPLTVSARGRSVEVAAAAAAAVRVEAFDALGRRVSVLFEGPLGAGEGRTVALSGVAPGVYFVRATAAGGTVATVQTVVR